MTDRGSVRVQNTGAFYDDLEKLLLRQIASQPTVLDLRLKLAELYYETRRVEAFVKLARQVQTMIPNLRRSPDWGRIVSMGRIIALDDPMFLEAEVADRVEYITAKASVVRDYKRIGEEERFRKPLAAVAEAYEAVRKDPRFIAELDAELIQSAGHPTSLQFAAALSRHAGGARIYLKREDLSAQSSHLLAAIYGQAMLAKRMGKKTLVGFSTNGRSGVVLASVAARLGLDAVVYMDSGQMQLQASNLFRMWMMGTQVLEAGTGPSKTGDIRKEAWGHWVANLGECFLVMGLDAAPHPYPMLALEMASVAGRECRRQLYAINKKVPDLLVARAGDNADAVGLFPPFLRATGTRLVCVEARDHLDAAAERGNGGPQALTLQEQQRAAVILEGMDYPRTTREHAWLKASGRVEYVKGSSAAAKRAVYDLSKHEGVIPAIETAYALGWALQEAAKMSAEQSVIVMVSEQVDKNIWQIGRAMGVPL